MATYNILFNSSRKVILSLSAYHLTKAASLSERFMEAAAGQAPEDPGSSGSGNKNINKYGNMNLKNFDNSDSDSVETEEISQEIKKGSPKKGSLADKANAVKRFNDSGV